MRHPDVCIGDLAPRRRLCARYRHGPEYGEAAGAAHHGDAAGAAHHGDAAGAAHHGPPRPVISAPGG